jgi:4-carboxymuconolactone decarboxylase
MILASTIASQALGEYKVMVGAALNVGLAPVVIKEILYQSVPYVGVAKVFDFLHATNTVFQEKGIGLPSEGQSTTAAETRFEKGAAAQKAIFGGAIDIMRRQSPGDQAHIHDFLAANCFGDYYTRNGIELKTRELLTFAMLISLGGCEPQVKGHVTGNLRMGNDRARLIDVVTQLLPYIGYPRTLNALRVIDEVVPPANPSRAAATAP